MNNISVLEDKIRTLGRLTEAVVKTRNSVLEEIEQALIAKKNEMMTALRNEIQAFFTNLDQKGLHGKCLELIDTGANMGLRIESRREGVNFIPCSISQDNPPEVPETLKTLTDKDLVATENLIGTFKNDEIAESFAMFLSSVSEISFEQTK